MKQVFVLTNTETDTVVGVFSDEWEAYLYADEIDPKGDVVVVEKAGLYKLAEDATKGIDTPV